MTRRPAVLHPVGMKAVAGRLLFFAAVVLCAGCDMRREPEARVVLRDRAPFVIGVLPFLECETLHAGLDPLAARLSTALGRPVRIRVTGDYCEAERLARRNMLDAGWFTPADGRLFIARVRPLPAAGAVYRGLLVVRGDGPVRSLADLAGRRIAFVDPRSRSGFLAPARLLLEAGLDLPGDLASCVFAGSHGKALERLLAGDVDAAAVSSVMVDTGRMSPASGTPLVILAESAPILPDPFVVRADLDPREEEIFRNTLLTLGSAEQDAAALSALRTAFGIRGFVGIPEDGE